MANIFLKQNIHLNTDYSLCQKDVAQGQMKAVPAETRTHSFWFARVACKQLHHQGILLVSNY